VVGRADTSGSPQTFMPSDLHPPHPALHTSPTRGPETALTASVALLDPAAAAMMPTCATRWKGGDDGWWMVDVR
jgi:hypothetical protein